MNLRLSPQIPLIPQIVTDTLPPLDSLDVIAYMACQKAENARKHNCRACQIRNGLSNHGAGAILGKKGGNCVQHAFQGAVFGFS